MMGFKTLIWAGFFGAMCLAALGSPIWGIVGYVGDYSVGANGQWWNIPLRPLGIRYSFTLAAFTAVGIAINWGKLRFGPSLLHRQEKLLLLFLGCVWLSLIVGQETVGRYTTASIDHPSMKFAKITIFVLMLTHVVTDVKNLNRLLWVLVIGALILGLQAYDTPRRAFNSGRLDRVGGPDFSEANFFAAYMAAMVPIIGIQFLRSKWPGRLLCLASGVFTVNAIVLTRSRGAVVGLAIGTLAGLILAPRRHRLKIIVCLIAALLGGLYLADPQFIKRSSTIFAEEGERDSSAQSRVLLAKASIQMVSDHPLGVGAGNFHQNIGRYIPEYAGKDAHNTYMRCITELGLHGAAIFVLLIGFSYVTLLKVRRQALAFTKAYATDVQYLGLGVTVSLSILLGCCLTISLTYVEFVWWIMALPICLDRVVYNLRHEPGAMVEDSWLLDVPEVYTFDDTLLPEMLSPSA